MSNFVHIYNIISILNYQMHRFAKTFTHIIKIRFGDGNNA